MENARRDLAQPEHWLRSLERSRVRRELAPRARRDLKRRKSMAASVAAAMAAGPGVPVAAAQMTTGSSPAAVTGPEGEYTVELREGGLPLDVGDTGALVAQVQKRLGIAADGIFGFQTDAAVRQFQLRANLVVDGIVGPATWAALFPQTSGAAMGGSNIPPQVKQGVERRLVEATQRVAAGGRAAGAGGRTQTGTSVLAGTGVQTGSGGKAGTQSGGGAPETGGGAPEAGAQTPAPIGGGACGSTISSPLKGTVTSPYGPRGGRNHDGVDIAAPMGTAIRAAACGTVSLAGQQSGYGNIVCIAHTSQFSTCYAHLSRFGVTDGQQVQQGQVIGYVGCTGNCTGPHLHFETRVDGTARNPSPYLGGSTIPGTAPRTSSTTTASAAIGGGSATETTTAVAEYRRTSTATASEGVEQDSFSATAAEPVESAAVQPASSGTTAPAATTPAPATTAPTTTAPATATAPTTTAPATTTAPTTTAPATTTAPTTTAPA